MRVFGSVVLLIFTAALVYVLDRPIGALPAIGRLVDPVNGCWANAERTDHSFTADLKLPVQQSTKVWLDERLVPHIHAGNDHDVYFAQGYLHASFRLWQMDLQTRAAAGRVSEVIGKKAFDFDRRQRRKGMVYGAERSLAVMDAEPRTKNMLDAYRDGINAYINTLKYRDYPLEYKLMGFAPEQWTNLKSALLLKYMADDLTGNSNDIPMTYLREMLTPDMFALLYPGSISGSSPVIPAGTQQNKPSLVVPQAPVAADVFPAFTKNDFTEARPDGIGSNNWAISGSRTESGAAILCNDPHLGLNLPSLWYEVQLQAPGLNVYGASLPGAPGIIIGFNDSVSWGFTNNYRDVKDYYLVQPVEGDGTQYIYDGKKTPYTQRLETIVIRNDLTYVDTVNYTVHGPVTFNKSFPAEGGLQKPLAMCWMGHAGTNELLAVYLMNRATGYDSWVDGILNFQCPAQNMVYADRQGNIALWGQGQFINKWKGQGEFIMNGATSKAQWGQLIPMRENPHVLNPTQGYVASANQCVTDASYPYWYNGDFVEFRSWRINQVLGNMQKASVADMFALQNDTYSILAANILPVMLRNLTDNFKGEERSYIDKLKKWDYKLSYNGVEGSVFQAWWYSLYKRVWSGMGYIPSGLLPLPERTMQLVQQADSGKTQLEQLKHLNVLVNLSFKDAMDSLHRAEKTGGLQWYKVKNTTVRHLAKLAPFSYDSLKIGGWGNTVNAVKGNHGPSWRMVVQMGKEIEAWGVYPGGQSGNPGSKYYADYLPKWTKGEYNRLLFLPNSDKQDPKTLKYTISIHQ